MALWVDIKIGQKGKPEPLVEIHMDDVESVVQVQDKLQQLGKLVGLG